MIYDCTPSPIRTPGWLARRFLAASVTVRSIRRFLVSGFLADALTSSRP
ncbi:hypothetical protein Rhow_004298 [Rhodococcus wratislaviensis]|uniref:Uncharacterized protein n=1 Tax=Rhodococcus wratislaviensis TaxID=44752 RepID=A0A402CAJ5_RHOWR|nr:hypothetical protein Rhow_004298 [Rhodococcus wratislaviensis]